MSECHLKRLCAERRCRLDSLRELDVAEGQAAEGTVALEAFDSEEAATPGITSEYHASAREKLPTPALSPPAGASWRTRFLR
jgi:hypothetical protein